MPRPAAREAGAPSSEDAGGRLVLAGVLLGLSLPLLVYSTASSGALRESKLLAQALGSSLALLGLAFPAAWGWKRGPDGRERAARVAAAGAGIALALAAASAAANARVVDPLGLAAVLSPLGLVAAGASRAGARAAARAATAVCALAAVSGVLAAAQRWAGVLRLPLQAPEPRFFAAGLVGNPGDLAMALVLPATLLFATAGDALRPPHLRGLAAAGLGAVLLGIVATESVAPALAFVAGALVWALLAPRRRAAALGVLVAALAAVAVLGGARRAAEKLSQIRRGDVASATTQRDIGLRAAAEMIRACPVLGVGPGAFSNAFVPARLAAEERAGRRLVHLSDSSHFENAHSEPVTLAAECGVPAAVAAAAAFVALLAGLASRRHGPGAEANPATDALIAALVAAGVLSLSGFPLRLPVASGPLAFFAGLAWRRTAPRSASEAAAPRGARAALAAAALVLLAAAAVRSAAVSVQADGENLLRTAASIPPEGAPERAELLSAAASRLRVATALRPRDATALLALGSVAWLEHDLEGAHDLYARSVALEERAESDFDLGRVAFDRGRTDEARAWFVRAVWILPRLADALPPGVDRDSIGAEISRVSGALSRGVPPPPRPPL